MTDDVIKIGDYIVVQKQNYKKLHKLNKPNSTVSLGRDTVNLSGIEGCPYFSVFRMVPKSKKGKEYGLELTEEALELKDEIDIKVSGMDNRNILDDGQSQKLSAAEIAEIANDATKAAEIVGTLISNSNTFHNKTEFSQEKYLKKKEKKYFEFIQILKPNLRLIAEIMYRLDPGKIQNIRIDTLSQIITLSNIQSEGNHLLYDSGSNGLVAAALLSAIGANTNGKLVHMHPGNMSQKQALLGMNFSQEQYNQCISVNIYSSLRHFYQGSGTRNKNNTVREESEPNPLKRKAEDAEDENNKKAKTESEESFNNEPSINDAVQGNTTEAKTKDLSNNDVYQANEVDAKPNKSSNEGSLNDAGDDADKNGKETESTKTDEKKQSAEPKKPKWHFDNIAACEILTQKVDSLVIACKEDPCNIFLELLPFVKPGRPFVVYYSVAEPLQHMFMELKTNAKIAALKLTCNWMRNYQVLPDRTHPEVMMNNQSGFLLTGYVLK